MVRLNNLIYLRRVRYNGGMQVIEHTIDRQAILAPVCVGHNVRSLANTGAIFIFNRRVL
jgi:hypothetical protein